jgi:hypothetical protein
LGATGIKLQWGGENYIMGSFIICTPSQIFLE